MCGTVLPKCIVCGVILTEENAYRKQGSRTGFQSRCKKHQIEYQSRLREKRKEQKGHTTIETKVAGDGSVRLRYNPRRQVVDIRGPIKAQESAFFFVEIFDRKWTHSGTEKEFHYRLVHVSRELWEEATVDMQTLEEFQEDAKQAKEIENAVHDRKSARRRRSGQEGSS